jgi:L-ascorbate metabolism protein UlaG (beta-lactamase superfamily)
MYTLIVIAIIILLAIFFFRFYPDFGGKPNAVTLSRIKASPNFRQGIFQNPEPTIMFAKEASLFKTIRKFMEGTENGRPKLVETAVFDKEKFLRNKEKITFAWFGHSTILLNVEGTIILTDPVFSRSASPFPFGNSSFKYSNDDYLETLPDIDILLISHDHYDHLDYKTIKRLKNKTSRFYVPLGVETHLIKWGVPAEKIKVADWWDGFMDESGLKITATPTRHFSGRLISDRNKTLWCSWVIKAKNHNLFFGGDSGYGKHFPEIGEKYGPFDLTMLECGQYNPNWPFIHSMPEQTITAHLDLKGEYVLPTHWGKFKLSLHPWDEPINRAKTEAIRKNAKLLESQIGEVFIL